MREGAAVADVQQRVLALVRRPARLAGHVAAAQRPAGPRERRLGGGDGALGDGRGQGGGRGQGEDQDGEQREVGFMSCSKRAVAAELARTRG